MNEIINLLHDGDYPRQAHKVKHAIADVLLLVVFAKTANIETWEEIEDSGLHYENVLKKYRSFANDIPSHDTIQRIMAIVSPPLRWLKCNASGPSMLRARKQKIAENFNY